MADDSCFVMAVGSCEATTSESRFVIYDTVVQPV